MSIHSEPFCQTVNDEGIDMINTKTKLKKTVGYKRIAKSKKNYETIMQEIQPFIKKRPISYPSTMGQWKTLSYDENNESD